MPDLPFGRLDAETAGRIHDEWAARQPADAPTFSGPDGNLYFSADAEFWRLIAAAAERSEGAVGTGTDEG